MPQFTIAEIASMLEAVPEGTTETLITGINKIEAAQQGDLTFYYNPKYTRFLTTTRASCVLVPSDFTAPPAQGLTFLHVPDPQTAFVQLMPYFAPLRIRERGYRHPTACIDTTAVLHPDVYVGAFVSVGAGCTLAEAVVLEAGVVLYENVTIDAGTVLHSNVVCYDGTQIGKRCIIHAGAVLGADGFGFAEQSDGSFVKIPQIGTVRVGNDVEIGANCTIDRAALGDTFIENGVKLDNLIHIAHNVIIGEHTAIAAQAGISGSTTVGKRNRIAGQVGIVGHISTTDSVTIYAQSGVAKSLTKPGAYFGSPAKPHLEALKIEAALKQVPDLIHKVRSISQKESSSETES